MIAIIQYNAGNTRSVKNAVDRLGYESLITNDPDTILSADKVILPGVGEAGSAMTQLRYYGLDVVIKDLKQPVLGICLGLQLLCNSSGEGNTRCLGIFDTDVKKFPLSQRVPHTGWNNLENIAGPLFIDIRFDDTTVYFVHSYYAAICHNTIATCNYILPFSAAMQKDNFYATQFHPEKSAENGEIILKNFLSL